MEIDLGRYRSLKTRSGWLVVFLMIMALMRAWSIFLSNAYIQFAQRIIDGKTVTLAEAVDLDSQSMSIYAFGGIASIIFYYHIVHVGLQRVQEYPSP